MLQQIVHAPETALHDPAKTHLVLPPVPHGLQRDRINVVLHESAVGARRRAEPLTQHTPEHGAQPVGVAVGVLMHVLDAARDADLVGGDVHDRVQQVQVRELPVDPVVQDVQLLEAVAARAGGVVERQGALQGAAFEGQGGGGGRVVLVVVGVDPCLRPVEAVGGDDDDDVFGPERPALGFFQLCWDLDAVGRLGNVRLK